jgi:FkbM family methyltransferase
LYKDYLFETSNSQVLNTTQIYCTFSFSIMLNRLVDKTKRQIEEIIWHKDPQTIIRIGLSVLNRRKIPLPAAVFNAFNQVDQESTDMGDENFLAPYMVPAEGKSFVDVGAATGGWSLYVAQQNRIVHAFEPSPKSFTVLTQRMKKYPNVHLYPYALGDSDSVGRLGLAASSLSGTMDAENKGLPGGGTIDIAVRRLDSLNLSNVGVIKVDTEGYEVPILEGAKSIVQKDRPRLVIEVHCGTGKACGSFREELQRIEGILRGYGYRWTVRSRQISLRDQQPFIIADPMP